MLCYPAQESWRVKTKAMVVSAQTFELSSRSHGLCTSSLPKRSCTAWDFLPFSYCKGSPTGFFPGGNRGPHAFPVLSELPCMKQMPSSVRENEAASWDGCVQTEALNPWRETITSSCKGEKRLGSSTSASPSNPPAPIPYCTGVIGAT